MDNSNKEPIWISEIWIFLIFERDDGRFVGHPLNALSGVTLIILHPVVIAVSISLRTQSSSFLHLLSESLVRTSMNTLHFSIAGIITLSNSSSLISL